MKPQRRMTYYLIVTLSLVAFLSVSAAVKQQDQEKKVDLYDVATRQVIHVEKVIKTEKEWKSLLTPEEFKVTRHKATELACSGVYWTNHANGIYKCICCGTDLFYSRTKFESGTGWPSFYEPVSELNIKLVNDDV